MHSATLSRMKPSSSFPVPRTLHEFLNTVVIQSFVAVTFASLYALVPFLPDQDCGECPTAYTSLVVPGTVQAEDFDLGGEVGKLSLRQVSVTDT